MALPDAFVESHSYSGGLRYTAFLEGGVRPAWAPPADSVGWRDDFTIDGDDAVIEGHQRAHDGEGVSWIAVYRRSVDAQFGDRSNHAGVGVWLRGKRIADARSLLLALDQYTTALARDLDPHALGDSIAEFASDRFLGRYLLPADVLPLDWSGAPPAAAILVDTQYDIVCARDFASAVDRAADRITRVSLGWSAQTMASRTIILATKRTAPPIEREFRELDPPGGMLAEVLQRIPDALEGERRRVRDAAAELAHHKSAWEDQKRSEIEQIELHRREMEMLDGLPPSPEGIAARLNRQSHQIGELHSLVQAVSTRPAPGKPDRGTPSQRFNAPVQQSPDRQFSTPARSSSSDGWLIAGMSIEFVVIIVLVIYLFVRV